MQCVLLCSLTAAKPYAGGVNVQRERRKGYRGARCRPRNKRRRRSCQVILSLVSTTCTAPGASCLLQLQALYRRPFRLPCPSSACGLHLTLLMPGGRAAFHTCKHCHGRRHQGRVAFCTHLSALTGCNTMNSVLRSDAVLKHHGGVDVLVNAAGFSAWQDENIIQGGCSGPCTQLCDAKMSVPRQETSERM